MRQALTVLAELLSGGLVRNPLHLPWHELRYQHTAAVRAQVVAPATANKALAALCDVLAEAYQLHLLAGEGYYCTARVQSVKASTLSRGRALALAETIALFDTCRADASPWGARDAAILSALYGCGLRRQELVALDLVDLDRASAALTVRTGKGGKERRTFLDAGALAALDDWLALRGELPGPLFNRIAYPSGRILGGPACPRSRSRACSISGARRRRSGRFLRTTFGARSLPTSSRPAPTSRRSRIWPAMRA